jgi:hypothetical protein
VSHVGELPFPCGAPEAPVQEGRMQHDVEPVPPDLVRDNRQNGRP